METILKYYDHNTHNPNNITPLVMHNRWSVIDENDISSRLIVKLLSKNIPEKTNMSLIDLLNLPMHALESIISNVRYETILSERLKEQALAGLNDVK